MAKVQRSIPPVFGPKEIGRLALLASVLVFVLLSMDRLRRPGAMEWILPPERPKAPPASANATADDASGNYNPLELVQTTECKEVDAALLAPIRDKTPRSVDDRAAIFQMMCVAATTPPAVLAAKSRTDVQFANLFNDPEKFRGKPIHLHGVLARLTAWKEKQDSNPYAIPVYHEGWIFTEDQPTNPVVVLFTGLPEGLHPGVSLKENVAIDAFFLKLLAYETQGEKVKAAPLLIGGDLQWRPVDAGGISREAMLAGAALTALLVVGAGVFWLQNRRDDRLADQLRTESPESVAPEIGFLEAAQSTSDLPIEQPTDAKEAGQ